MGKIKQFKELSGMAMSHENPGVFYSIEDSRNKENVYVFHINGTLIGNSFIDV